MITPTIGRVVWFQPAKQADQPLRTQPFPALIAYVHSDTCINVGFFDQYGVAGNATSVRLVQEGEDVLVCDHFAEWMPYQVGQAKKHEPQPPVDNAHVAPGCEQFSDADIEHAIQAKGKTAARVTPDHIQATIKTAHYFTAQQGAMGAAPRDAFVAADGPLTLLTFCVLVLQNGFTVTGESACASPENFDAEIGRKIARQNAEQKIWMLEGYLLKQNLFEDIDRPV